MNVEPVGDYVLIECLIDPSGRTESVVVAAGPKAKMLWYAGDRVITLAGKHLLNCRGLVPLDNVPSSYFLVREIHIAARYDPADVVVKRADPYEQLHE